MSLERPFTTKPKTRRHGHFISGDRCRVFMEHCWEKGLRKKASYDTLEFEFIHCFETNDSRTVHKYIGRQGEVVSHQASNMVRVNRISGKVAQFNYRTTRRISRKRGLLATLGYISYCEKGYYHWNHELLPYFTEQTTLEVSPQPPLQEVNGECSDVSMDNLRVCCGGEVIENGEAIEDLAVRVGKSLVREKKEEEVIESAHANPCLYPNMKRKACVVYSKEVME